MTKLHNWQYLIIVWAIWWCIGCHYCQVLGVEFVCSPCVLLGFAGRSGFLQQSKVMQVRLTVASKLPIGVSEHDQLFVSMWQPYDELATLPVCMFPAFCPMSALIGSSLPLPFKDKHL